MRRPPSNNVTLAPRPILEDHGSVGTVMTCPFSILVRLPVAGSCREDPAERLTLGRNAAYAERTSAALVRLCPSA